MAMDGNCQRDKIGIAAEMDDSAKGLRVRSFFDIEARTLLERFRVIETLLPNSTTKGAAHRGEEGRYIETLIRAFLNKHLPNNLKAVTGFILRPSTKTGIQDLGRVYAHEDRHSSQLDIIVYDIDGYPVFEKFEEFCIVPPEGVVGVISVKKRLYDNDIKDEIASLKAAADLCRDAPQEEERPRRGPFTALVAFTAENSSDERLNKRIFQAISSVHENAAFDTMINEASVLGRNCVFKVRRGHGPEGHARYVAVDCAGEPHIPLQRLLQSLMSVYYDVSRASGRARPGFVSFRKRTFADAPEIGLVPYSEA